MSSRFLIIAVTGALLVLSFGCSDPAANKPKAEVQKAAPETSPTKSAGAETLAITPENSKVEFVASKVTRSHNGSFKQFTGTIDLADNSPENSRVTIEIQTNSVVTDEDGLTKHLQTPDFFDVNKFPKATFTSTKIEANKTGGATHNVTGNFELHGVKNLISFPATIQVAPDSASVNAEFSINRKDWGLIFPGKPDDLIREGVVIKLTKKTPRKSPS